MKNALLFPIEHGEFSFFGVRLHEGILPAHIGYTNPYHSLLRSGEAFDEARSVCGRCRQITYGALSRHVETTGRFFAFVRCGSQLMSICIVK